MQTNKLCLSLCEGLLGWLLQWLLLITSSVEHASCPSRRHSERHCLSPALLHGIQPDHGDQLMLIHLTTDRLCQWHPNDETLSSFNCKYCIVDRSTLELREHFGTCEHSYGHWIDLSLPHGRYPLWQLLRQYPDVALPQCRDIAPLRLVSSVSCEVPAHVQQVLDGGEIF